MRTDPVPWLVTAVEHPGGTWLRISHVDGTLAAHDLARLSAAAASSPVSPPRRSRRRG